MVEICTMKNAENTRPLTDIELTAENLLPKTPEMSILINSLICLATLLLSILSVFLYT